MFFVVCLWINLVLFVFPSHVSVWFYFAKFRIVLLEVQDLKKRYCRKLITDFLWSFKFFHGSLTNSIKIFMVPPHLKGQLGQHNHQQPSRMPNACRMPITRSNPYILWLQPFWRRRKNPRWSVLVWGISWGVGEKTQGDPEKKGFHHPKCHIPDLFVLLKFVVFFVLRLLVGWLIYVHLLIYVPLLHWTLDLLHCKSKKQLEFEVTFMGHGFSAIKF